VQDSAAQIVRRLTDAGLTVAVAESLTGGAVCDALVAVPGASACLRGGVVAYATETKSSVLGVDADLLARRGPVDPQVVTAMAAGVRALFCADLGVATTGVAGPDPQDGHAPGEVHVAVADATGVNAVSLQFTGGRTQIRHAARDAALRLLLDRLDGSRLAG
jgi:PncC family amidohydrolase